MIINKIIPQHTPLYELDYSCSYESKTTCAITLLAPAFKTLFGVAHGMQGWDKYSDDNVSLL